MFSTVATWERYLYYLVALLASLSLGVLGGLVDAAQAYRTHVAIGVVGAELYLVCGILGFMLWHQDHHGGLNWFNLKLPVREVEVALTRMLSLTSIFLFTTIIISLASFRLENSSLVWKFILMSANGVGTATLAVLALSGYLRGREYGAAAVICSLLVLLVLGTSLQDTE